MDAQLRWAALVSKVGSLALHRNPRRAVLVFKNFYGPAIPARSVIIIRVGLGEWDVLPQYLGRAGVVRRSQGELADATGGGAGGRSQVGRPGRLRRRAGVARRLPRLLH